MSDFLKKELGDWYSLLKPVIESEDFKAIPEKIKNNFTPVKSKIFRAYNKTPFHKLKVVILGQNPYHGEKGLATGLAFGVPALIQKTPPSLKNIVKEVERSGKYIVLDTSLEHWAEQGVLLLNTSLTSELGEIKNVHSKYWEPLIVRTLEAINNYSTGVIFLLWGNHAQSYKRYIWESSNTILEASHPSPLSARKGFAGCGHFDKVNTLLKGMNNEIIKW